MVLKTALDIVDIFLRDDPNDTCDAGNEYDGQHFPARISSIFVILVASAFGSFFPVLSSKYSFIRMPPICFFVAKFFGSGVIVATAFIHLLQPANENLSNDCLGYPFDIYPIAFGICLIVLMTMFFIELIAYRWIESKISGESVDKEQHNHSHFGDADLYTKANDEPGLNNESQPQIESHSHSHLPHDSMEDFDYEMQDFRIDNTLQNSSCAENHDSIKFELPAKKEISSAISLDLSSSTTSTDIEKNGDDIDSESKALFAGQLMNVFVLEFGIIFHSVFVGLTLSCAGDEFISLYIVLVFHQMFEGLGLGTRIASVDWPKSKRLTPWLLCLGYTLSTPIAIAIGLGVRDSYPPGSRRALITNGVFDSISAGILIYTGLIELMAHEFLFSDEFKGEGGFRKMLLAYFVMCLGAGLMALLGRWA